jgi:PAS domain S-box-containing protein
MIYAGITRLPALMTLIELIVINIGCLISYGVQSKMMRVFLSDSVRARLIRTFLPLTIFIVLLEGWFDSSYIFVHFNNVMVHTMEAALLSLVLVIVIGTVSNVIGKKIVQTETALRNSEIRFKAITEQAMDGITLADMSGKYKFVNQAFCKMVGYTEADLLQMDVFDLRYPDDETSTFNTVKQLKQNIVPRKKLLCKDKSFIYADINGKVINIIGEEMVMGIVRNVTQQVIAENELISAKESAEESERKYRNLFDNAVEGVYHTSSEGRFISVNKAFADMLGFETPEEVISEITDIANQLYVNPLDREIVKDILKKQEFIKDFETQFRRKDGNIIWVSINARVSQTPDNSFSFSKAL